MDKLLKKYDIKTDMDGPHTDHPRISLSQFDELPEKTRKALTPQIELREGRVGTIISRQGQIEMDPNRAYRPYILRGTPNNLGLYDEISREANVYRATTEIRNLIAISPWSLSKPEGQEEHAAFLEKKFQDVLVGDQQRGMRSLVDQALTNLIFGFSIFEIVWATDPQTKWVYPQQILFREPSTVKEWVIDGEEDRLAAVNFETPDRFEYTLRAYGPHITDKELLTFTLNRRGQNYEGISPLRPVIFWVQLKILLSKIAGAAADLQGVPVRYIRNALETVLDQNAYQASQEQLDEVADLLVSVEEGDDTIITLPNGVEVGMLAREGMLIDVKPLIEYCDLQIMIPLSSEGTLLGQQALGSYALSESTDKKFLSQLPYYRDSIALVLDDLIRSITNHNIGAQEDYPQWDAQIDTARDPTAMLNDFTTLMEQAVWTWPPPMREALLASMNLDPQTFDEWDPAPYEATKPKDHLQYAETEIDGDSLTGPITIGEAFNAEKNARLLDRYEKQLASRLRAISQRHKSSFQNLLSRPQELTEEERRRLDRRIENEFEPLYIKESEAILQELARRSGKDLLRDLGLDESFSEITVPEAVKSVATNLGRTIFNRTHGNFREQTERLIGAPQKDRVGLQVLKPATLLGEASKAVSTAFNRGRHESLTQAVGPDPELRIYGTRSAVMDGSTCEECERLDGRRFEYGSDQYLRHMPPNYCEGRGRCRCVMTFEIIIE